MTEDKAKCGSSLYWHNCYSGSHDLLTGNSMAHPAKMSPKLCFRILEHLEELGLASPEKDTILDPMAGTGLTAICAGAKGYKAVTVELEQKFIDMCQTYLCLGVVHYSVKERILPAVEAGWVTSATGGLDENGELEYRTYYTKALPERKRYVVTASSRCGNREWHPVHRVIGNKQYAERKLYKSLDWQILKGDSRQLSSLLTGNTLKSVTSPPYGDQVIKDGQRLASNPDIHWREWDRGTKYNLDNPDNIGNLKDVPLKSITSPPYQDSQGHPSLGNVNKDDWGKAGKDIVKRRGLSGEYGDTEGQVGKLKSVMSPPYQDALPNGLDRKAAEQMVRAMYDKHGRTYSKEDFEYQVELILKRSNREYGDAEGQIGKLKDKPLKSIVSPPYSEAQSGGGIAKKGYTGSKHSPTDLVGNRSYMPEVHGQSEGQIANLKDTPLKSITSPPYGIDKTSGGLNTKPPRDEKDQTGRSPNSPSQAGAKEGYGETEGQIGVLKDTPLKSIVSSPYGDAEKRDRSKEASNEKEKDYPRGDHNISAGYQGSDDNIGKLADKPLKSVMSPPYEDAKGDKHHSPRADVLAEEKGMFETYTERGVDNVGNEKGESYLQAMLKVYKEISLVSDVLCVVVKCPTRGGKLRRLDLDTISILEASGWKIHCQHRALLFEELEQADMFEGSKKKVKGRLSFFKRLSWQNGNPVASWEDIIVCVRS